MIIRKTSHLFRDDIDNSLSPTAYTGIEFSIREDKVVMTLDEGNEKTMIIEYWRTGDKFCMSSGNIRVVGGDVNNVERAVRDMVTIFKNSRASVSMLCIPKTDYVRDSQFTEKFSKDRKSFLDTFEKEFRKLPNSKIGGIRFGWVLSEDEMMQVISRLKPVHLKSLRLEPTKENTMKCILESEHYNHLEVIYVKDIKLEHLFHKQFRRDTRIVNATATIDDLKTLLTVSFNACSQKNFMNSLQMLLQDHCDRFVLRDLKYDKNEFLAHLHIFYDLPPFEDQQHVVKMFESDDYIAILFKDPHLYFCKVDENFGIEALAGRPIELCDDGTYPA